MHNVLIIVDSDGENNSQPGNRLGTTAQMVSAMQQAILHHSNPEKGDRSSPFPQDSSQIQVIEALVLEEKIACGKWHVSDDVVCPLTLNVSEKLVFPGRSLFNQCRDTEALRQRVETWGYATGSGHYWLPIALTAKGPLYAEVIGTVAEQVDAIDPSDGQWAAGYIQPIHLSDAQRQSLYELGHRLLRSLQAIPSVYLIQFGLKDQKLWFDRLFPFPAAPAIASMQVQQPDLFTCHWRCLTHQPLRELSIVH